MTLEVLICTYGKDGLNRVSKMNLPKIEGVRYLISLQTNEPHTPLLDELIRKDISISTTNSTGLSNNRNNSLNNATGDICLIADDDLSYTAEQLQSIINVFEQNQSLDIALFRHSGNNNKQYPGYEFDLSKKFPKGYYITSFEIAFRRKSIPSSLRFDSRLGIGAAMPAGEETLFIHQALKEGLTCRFFPITIVCHKDLSTGSRTPSANVIQANGAIIAVRYGLLGLMRLPIIAWRLSRQGKAKFFPAVHHLLKGYIYGKRNF